MTERIGDPWQVFLNKSAIEVMLIVMQNGNESVLVKRHSGLGGLLFICE